MLWFLHIFSRFDLQLHDFSVLLKTQIIPQSICAVEPTCITPNFETNNLKHPDNLISERLEHS